LISLFFNPPFCDASRLACFFDLLSFGDAVLDFWPCSGLTCSTSISFFKPFFRRHPLVYLFAFVFWSSLPFGPFLILLLGLFLADHVWISICGVFPPPCDSYSHNFAGRLFPFWISLGGQRAFVRGGTLSPFSPLPVGLLRVIFIPRF